MEAVMTLLHFLMLSDITGREISHWTCDFLDLLAIQHTLGFFEHICDIADGLDIDFLF
jgi:hypothetical protein